MALFAALLPAVLLAVFALWAGSFDGGAAAAGALSGQVALLAAVAWGGSSGALRWDALRLGRWGRWLPPALVLAVAASLGASPVPRAGRVGLVLLPAFLLLPAVVERCWVGEARRRAGLLGVAAAVAGVAGWALVDHLAFGSPRASAPLGHHNLLAVWLLAVLPVAVLPVRERGWGRGLGAAAGGLGIAALLATRSLLGLLALAGLLAAAVWGPARGWVRSWRDGRQRRGLAPAAAVAGLLAVGIAVGAAVGVAAGPRLTAVLAGRDLSARARAVYAEAGWEGFTRRPLLGWGPGSTPWTVSGVLAPRPGINPPGEVLGQLHSLPIQLAYELGAPGLVLALALAAAFSRRRWRERRGGTGARDPALLTAALAGLAASGVALLGSSDLAVTALPLALAVVAGAALAAAPGSPVEAAPSGASWGSLVYASLALVVLLPPARAQFHYDRSLRLTGPEAARELEAAVALDPQFPLYRAWQTWIGGTGPLGRRVAAEPALEAARDAVGVGPLWLMAGVYGLEAREPWAEAALVRACRLDPLSALAPYYLTALDPAAPEAPQRGARALLAEPRLLAASFWKDHPELLAAALVELDRWPGVEAGWRAAFLKAAADFRTRPSPRGREELLWGLDESGMESLSLHIFRRLPRTARLAPVSVLPGAFGAELPPPASRLPGTSREAFGDAGCRMSEASELSTENVEKAVENPWILARGGATAGLCAL